MKQLIFSIIILFGIIGCDSADNTSPVENPTASTTPVENESSNGKVDVPSIGENNSTQIENTYKTFVPEARAKSWYVRLVAEAPERKLITYSTQLGMIDEANAAQEYSLSHYAPFAPYVDIKFVDPVELDSGDYKSYFKDYSEEASWTFTVRSDDPNANIVLSWRGIYVAVPYDTDAGERRYKEYISRRNPILKYMQIVDESTGESTPVIIDHELQSIAFNMNGNTERTFRWELLPNEVEQVSTIAVKNKSVNRQRSAVRALRSVRKVQKTKAAKFDMFLPPDITQAVGSTNE